MIKNLVLQLINTPAKISRAYSDHYQRYYAKLVQYLSVRKKQSADICKRYPLSRTQKDAVDALYRPNYGHKVSYKWHSFYAGHNGIFSEKYIPLSIYYSEVEYFMNPNKAYIKVFEDKSIISLIAKSAGIQTPTALLTCNGTSCYDSDCNQLTLHEASARLRNAGSIFMKPSIDSCSGRGCKLYQMHDGTDSLTGESIQTILEKAGAHFLVQKVIRNHPSISAIYSKSLNTFRVITYQWKGEYYHAPVIMRIGRHGSTVDNACAGGIYIGVDPDGKLHDNAYSVKGEHLSSHPDSGIIFKDYSIVPLTGIIESALKMHRLLPMLGIVNWDFTIDEQGHPVLIEANIVGGGMWMIQIAHGKGLFEERTPEILRWLKHMKSVPINKRHHYFCGNQFE